MATNQHTHVRPVVCGHRGAAAVAPENTLQSFDAAIPRGATWVEFDVRPCGDGTLVVHHDPVTSRGIHIASSPRAALDPSIPTLAEVVDRCSGIGLDIELKTDDVAIDVAGYVQLAGDEIGALCAANPRLVIVTSFDVVVLAGFRTANPGIATGLLFHDRSAEWAIATALGDGHGAIAPWFRLVDPTLVEAAHSAGLEVLTWTVNEPADIVRMAEAAVDMIIGDDPAVIVETLAALDLS